MAMMAKYISMSVLTWSMVCAVLSELAIYIVVLCRC